MNKSVRKVYSEFLFPDFGIYFFSCVSLRYHTYNQQPTKNGVAYDVATEVTDNHQVAFSTSNNSAYCYLRVQAVLNSELSILQIVAAQEGPLGANSFPLLGILKKKRK